MGRFVTIVKLNRGLKTSKYDQLYAYLKQHEAHANENKIMLERYTQHVIDPLALVSNVSPHQYPSQSSVNPQSAYVPPVNYQLQFADNKQPDSAGNGGVHNRVGNANPGQAKPIKRYNCNGIGHIARQCTHPKRPQNSEYFKDKMLLMQAQENGVVLVEEQLLFIAGGQTNTFDDDVDEAPVQDLTLKEDNVFQADECDAFDSDVDEAPTAQTMFIANLSSVDPIYDEAGPSYDSDILSEVQDHDNYIDSVGEYHEVHEMQNDVQPNYVVDSDAEYTSDSNIILYNQYVKDNVVQVVQSNVSSVPNDALMMIINDMHEQAAQCVSTNEQTKVVNESLTAELARYKEQVELYEKGQDRNVQEELLKKELHSVKIQLNSTINHNKLIKEVTTLKKDFKQKENKYLEEFLDMKQLKEKVEDKLYKQDQSLQTVHMLCKPKPFYDEKKKVAIGYKNPLYLTKAKKVQLALYNGHELVKNKHASAIMHDSEDTLKIAETTRMKMLEKSKSTFGVMNNVNIVSRFSEMHDAYTVEQVRCLELEAEISKLKHKIEKDDHSEMIKRFSNLEIDHLNFQLKYQNLKERFGNNKSQTSQDAPEFDSYFEINKIKASLQGKDNAIRKLKEKISQMNERRSEADHILDFKILDFQNTKLTEKLTALQEQNELFRA
ncbi:retrovirus-related pol polyprotein from transposon TNT 1-94 [Tanacetum coccineum]